MIANHAQLFTSLARTKSLEKAAIVQQACCDYVMNHFIEFSPEELVTIYQHDFLAATADLLAQYIKDNEGHNEVALKILRMQPVLSKNLLQRYPMYTIDDEAIRQTMFEAVLDTHIKQADNQVLKWALLSYEQEFLDFCHGKINIPALFKLKVKLEWDNDDIYDDTPCIIELNELQHLLTGEFSSESLLYPNILRKASLFLSNLATEYFSIFSEPIRENYEGFVQHIDVLELGMKIRDFSAVFWHTALCQGLMCEEQQKLTAYHCLKEAICSGPQQDWIQAHILHMPDLGVYEQEFSNCLADLPKSKKNLMHIEWARNILLTVKLDNDLPQEVNKKPRLKL